MEWAKYHTAYTGVVDTTLQRDGEPILFKDPTDTILSQFVNLICGNNYMFSISDSNCSLFIYVLITITCQCLIQDLFIKIFIRITHNTFLFSVTWILHWCVLFLILNDG